MVRTGKRRGFTQLELIVALTVLALLTALVLPAVMSARESSRRMQCAANLSSFGSAIHAYQSMHAHFPPLIHRTEHMTPNPAGLVWTSSRPYSPHVLLMPHMDQTAIWQQIDLGAYPPVRKRRDELPELFRTVIPVFLCPSDGTEFGNNYRVCTGSGVGPIEQSTGGAFADLDGRPQMFRDGMSHTAAMCERMKSDEHTAEYDSERDYHFSGATFLPGGFGGPDGLIEICASLSSAPQAYDPYTGHNWHFGEYDSTWYNHVTGPNSPVPDCTIAGATAPPMHHMGAITGIHGADSRHPGGVNLLLMDGSVRFVQEEIDLGLWRALATRAGSEAPGQL